MSESIPFLMHADALKLKETAEQLRQFNPSAHVAVSATALLSLIEQAHSPNLGLATTKEIREELEARSDNEISRQDDYKTFDPLEAH